MEHFINPDEKLKTVAIIGIGLIGGSLAAKIRARGLFERIIGVDNDPTHCEVALKMRLVDEIDTIQLAVRKSGLIVLATPVDSMLRLLPLILDTVTDQVVMDTGSTKAQICDKVNGHACRGRYVATHPVWGSDMHGPAAARAESFENKVAVICEAGKSDPDALLRVKELYSKLGMRVVEMNPKDHDIHTAYISHLPHVISYALANTVLEKERKEDSIRSLASGGFDSATRLAKSSSNVWTPILNQNRDNVLFVLDEYMDELKKFRNCLERGNCGDISYLIEHANFIKEIVN